MTQLTDTVLVVDDEAPLRQAISEYFGKAGLEVSSAGTLTAAKELFRRVRPNAVVVDYRLPDGNALEFIRQIRALDASVPVIVLTGHGSIDLAVQAIKEGAEQFLTKPVELPALSVVVQRAIENHRNRQKELAGSSRQTRENIRPFVGTSPSIRRVEEQITRVVRTDYPILLLGETGTGKGVLAKWIHQQSSRSREPFVDLNCAGFSRELLETELFGHERGAFTGAVTNKTGLFEVAHRGTVFLDEIGDMDPSLQPKLLKVVEERRFRRLGDTRDRHADVRLIAATHHDLAGMVQKEMFRADLYFRINTVSVTLPALRHRRNDLPELSELILRHVASEVGKPGLLLNGDAIDAMMQYEWPGNIRELRNVMERAALLCDGDMISRKHLQFESFERCRPEEYANLTLDQVERLHIERVLALENGNVGRAAARLGIPRSTMYYLLNKFKSAGTDFTT